MLYKRLKRCLHSSSDAPLPQRLIVAIRQQQDNSEILISAIQILIGVVFASLYTLSPKTFAADTTFAPVPWALSIYLIFSLIRLRLAIAGKLPDGLLYFSAVLDVALLLGLIWSFHWQYNQPPSFYLKAPTLLYVFIFIGIRSLHFDPRFVIATGVSAAIGWLLMLSYVILTDANHTMITKDYVEYMTSNSLLIGAEFDKIISILLVTGVLALALQRARQLLVESVIESSAARDLSHFVPDVIAQRVTQSEEGATNSKGEVNEATILFTDIEGFTSISEKISPEELIQALNEYFTLIAKPIEEYGGVISQFQGDAILATFNAPIENPDHASNAIRAALAIQKLVEGRLFANHYPFNTRAGINTGNVVGGLVGSGTRVYYTVHGENVNLTARLEQLNKQYGTRIIVSANTHRLIAADKFNFRPLGEVSVRGLQQSIQIYTID